MRILLSYHYFKTTDLDALIAKFAEPPEVFADSGAYSAFTQGSPVNLAEYGAWLQANRRHFTVMANLDDMTSVEATWGNQRVLEQDYGLPVLPVVHSNEPVEVLDRYLDAGYPYLALGGMVGKPAKALLWWALQAHQRAAGRAVFHGFGMTSWALLAALPWYSVDSSSWGSSYRYGQLRLYDPTRGAKGWRQVQMFTPEVGRYAALIRDHGGDPKIFRDRSLYHRHAAAAVSAVAWWRAEQWLRKRHGPIAMPRRAGEQGETEAGMLGYLTDGSASGVRLVDAEAGVKGYLADANTQGANLVPGVDAMAAYAAEHVNWYLADGSAENLQSDGLRNYLATSQQGMNAVRSAEDGLRMYLASSHYQAMVAGESGKEAL